ncbi:hypothetical protein S83_068450 [Arachis hypogaea]
MRKTFYFKTLSNDVDRDKDFLLPLEPLETLVDADDEEDFLLPLETLEFLGDAASYVSETLCGDEEDESKFAIRVFSSRTLLGGNKSGESKGDKTDVTICCCGSDGGDDDDGERCTGGEGFYRF